ncbi:putative FBD-associated F-box protein At5g56700 isoform X2 [Medicago truncatula]|uniref:F-box/RNI/FBD-like domain protein n=2 Tax=Medicago truncatula TaxID=3880 RepID=G7LEL8_MEDTR|nr:putative FBD-associated F-box protein At5g56700 isoform X2 [Medicago truncatula]AET03063.1 F-box/RNI/FBD-like domain protein [Medicago truncatula]
MAEEENNGGENNDGIDRISTLSNSLLCHILSFLPTKTSVHMSFVSRKWRNLWKNLEVFDFRDKCNEYSYQAPDDEFNEQFMLFTVFVNTVLSLRRSRVVRKFRLSSDHIPNNPLFAYSVDTWLSIAIGPHLQEFHLTLFTAGAFDNLPPTLFSCSNLISLSLSGYILLPLQDPLEICLPSLKVLQLLNMHHLNLSSMHILLSACPVLENLELFFSPESLDIIRVPSSLKRLKITVDNNVGAWLEIDAPGLKYLSLECITFRDAAAVGNLHSVEEAYLDVFPTPKSESVEPLLNLLRALSGIKHLELHNSTTKWLFAAPILNFPEFHYLLHLKLEYPPFNSTFLFDVLQKCPMLETLIAFMFDIDMVDRSYDSLPSYRWEAKPKSVPKCLISHLTFIHFYGVPENELEFIGYVLQHGLVLKTMIIDEYWRDQPDRWMKKISDLPRGSAMCQVKFL